MNQMKVQKQIRTYSQLMTLKSFAERLEYLQLKGGVGFETFGPDRYFNQLFYRSVEWKRLRDYVIVRDNGCDLGIPELPIRGKLLVHHMNPLELSDIQNSTDALLNPEYLITVCHETHNAIHYGNQDILSGPVERTPFDTCPWRKNDGKESVLELPNR